LVFERRGSVRVGWIVGMLTAIEFDHYPVFGTGEVDDEVSNRMLSAKSVSKQAPIA
jgi:hypothetical protein